MNVQPLVVEISLLVRDPDQQRVLRGAEGQGRRWPRPAMHDGNSRNDRRQPGPQRSQQRGSCTAAASPWTVGVPSHQR